MSKIYEALLRAEKERAATTKDQPRTTETVTAVDTAPAPLPGAEPVIFEQQTHAAALRRSTDPQARNPFGPDQVTATVWHPVESHLPAMQDRGRALEQFRSLRSHMFEFRDQSRLKSILVASGLPQEGKSFIAANLAISLARHRGARVLLIDGDMRRSSLHHALGCANEIGLSTFLAGRATLHQVMQRAIPDAGGVSTNGLNSLTFVSGGNDGDNAADLSGNPRFQELINTVSPHFDWIVVDTSPVNLVSDGVNLSRACDGVLLVARGGVTKLETAQRALNELKASRLLGVVLNAVSELPASSSYYGYDSYDGYDTIKETA